MNYIIRAYKVQSKVLICSLLFIYAYFYIVEGGKKTLTNPLGSTIVIFLLFELIYIPINTIYLKILDSIKFNRVKIKTDKSIAIYALLSGGLFIIEVIFYNHYTIILPKTWQDSDIVTLALHYSIIGIGLFIINIFVYVKKKIAS